MDVTPPTLELEYASPGTVKPPSNTLYRLSLWGSIVAGAVGVLTLGVYAISGIDVLPVFGFWWLGIGGAITVVAFILGSIYGGIGLARKFPPPSTKGRAWLVVILPVVNFGLAAGCFFGGLWLMGYHARSVNIINEGTTQIDRVELQSKSFSWKSGPLRPGDRVKAHYPNRSMETLELRVFVGGKSTPYVVTESMTADELRGPRWVHLNGLTGYRNYIGNVMR